MTDWAPASDSPYLTRHLSYIKPLTGAIGPSKTKCVITDQIIHLDFDDYAVVVSTTTTPNVPSGGSFCVKTRVCMTWARGNSCRVHVTTGVEWTKSSFIKGTPLLPPSSPSLSLDHVAGCTDEEKRHHRTLLY